MNSNFITMTREQLKSIMMETVWQMCDGDAKDSAAYLYAFARLMENIEEEQDDV
jgi:hypothetical protein